MRADSVAMRRALRDSEETFVSLADVGDAQSKKDAIASVSMKLRLERLHNLWKGKLSAAMTGTRKDRENIDGVLKRPAGERNIVSEGNAGRGILLNDPLLHPDERNTPQVKT